MFDYMTSKRNTRKNTTKMLDLVEEGMVNKDDLIHNLLNWMSEADVTEFMNKNEYMDDEE